jgi:hypothetical protein
MGEYGCLDRLSCAAVDEWRRMDGVAAEAGAGLQVRVAVMVEDEGT